ncbi:MAG: hypothetical protein NZ805_05940 [Armatimonadetes bacterium]|nr:hypothetical protein [Armatimonadota bacterium]MDW8029583.1 hypothetical protein [Armatimonadota bacterium]
MVEKVGSVFRLYLWEEISAVTMKGFLVTMKGLKVKMAIVSYDFPAFFV